MNCNPKCSPGWLDRVLARHLPVETTLGANRAVWLPPHDRTLSDLPSGCVWPPRRYNVEDRRLYRPPLRRLARLLRPAAMLLRSIGGCVISHVYPTRRSWKSWTVSLGSLIRDPWPTCPNADLRNLGSSGHE